MAPESLALHPDAEALIPGSDAGAPWGLHLAGALEVLEHGPMVERDGSDPALGPLVRVTGVTTRGRAVVIRAQAERLPMTVVALEGDQEAPLLALSSRA